MRDLLFGYIALVCIAFVILYAAWRPWYKSGTGWNLMSFTATVGFLAAWFAVADRVPMQVIVGASIVVALCVTHRLALLVWSDH